MSYVQFSLEPLCEATGRAGGWGQRITVSFSCFLLLTLFRLHCSMHLTKHRTWNVTTVWINIYYKFHPLFLHTRLLNNPDLQCKLLAFPVQDSQPRTLQQFDYTLITNSTLCHCEGASPFQEQQDRAIADPKVILHYAGQWLRGPHRSQVTQTNVFLKPLPISQQHLFPSAATASPRDGSRISLFFYNFTLSTA